MQGELQPQPICLSTFSAHFSVSSLFRTFALLFDQLGEVFEKSKPPPASFIIYHS
jgi:hypothetical protein